MKGLKFDYLFYIIIVLLLLLFALAARAQNIRQEKLTTVKIYLLDHFEAANSLGNLSLQAVEREVSAKSPLRSAIEAQLAGATEEEISNLLYPPISGIDLISVKLKNKTVYARFTRTGTEDFGKFDALRFRNAVRRTALQFPSVRKIEICLDGISDFWLIGARTHRKCL